MVRKKWVGLEICNGVCVLHTQAIDRAISTIGREVYVVAPFPEIVLPGAITEIAKPETERVEVLPF